MNTQTTTDFTICPKMENAFGILGKKWNGLIISVLLSEGTQRFGELATKIPMVSDRVLTARLKELEEENVIVRVVNCASGGNRIEYSLTEKGRALETTLAAVRSWGESFC